MPYYQGWSWDKVWSTFTEVTDGRLWLASCLVVLRGVYESLRDDGVARWGGKCHITKGGLEADISKVGPEVEVWSTLITDSRSSVVCLVTVRDDGVACVMPYHEEWLGGTEGLWISWSESSLGRRSSFCTCAGTCGQHMST